MGDSWSSITLRQVAHVEMGQSPPSEYVSEREGLGLPFLQGNAEFSEQHPHPRLWCRKPAKKASAGDALISVRAPVGEINSADQTYCIGRGLAAIRFTGLHPGFGYHALGLYAEALRSVAQGTTFEAVGGNELRHLRFPQAPLPEQRRIAEILDTLDEAIRKTEQVIAKLQQMKQGLLHDLLTRGIDDNGELRDPEQHPEQFKDSPLGLVPKAWNVAQFGQCLADTPQNGLYKPSTYYGDDGTPIIRIDGFYDGILTPVPAMKRLRLAPQEVSTYALEPGNILVNRVNSIDFVGKAALVPDLGQAVVFESNIMRCRLLVDRLLPGFGILWLTGAWARRWFFRRAKSAIAQASVNQTDVGQLRVVVPELGEQRRVVVVAKGVERRLTSESAQLAKLRTLKHGLMDDLLTGRVRVSVPEEAAA